MRTAISVLLIASSWVVVDAQDPGQCYYPGGLANDFKPCDPKATTSLCCPVGWTCFSNHACVVTDLTLVRSTYPLGTTIRGSCTNPLWNDGACGDICLNDPTSTPSANNGPLVGCGGGNWCCASDAANGSCDCLSGNGTFKIPQGVAQTTISLSSLVITDTAAPTSTSSMSMTTTATTLATITGSSSQTSRISQTTSTQTSPTSSPSGTAISSKTAVTSRLGFKIGAGVGALVALLGFLGYWFVYRHKSNGRSRLDFASRASSASPAYTTVRAAYDIRRSEYGPFNAASLYERPPPIPARNSYNYGAPSPLLTPDLDERPVSPEEEEEYGGNYRSPSTAMLRQ